jgi:hypothetical protein
MFTCMWQDMYLTQWFLAGVNRTLMILNWAITIYNKKVGFEVCHPRCAVDTNLKGVL